MDNNNSGQYLDLSEVGMSGKKDKRAEQLKIDLAEYERLVDVKFTRGLSDREERALERLTAVLDAADTPAYRKTLKRLRAELGVFQ